MEVSLIDLFWTLMLVVHHLQPFFADGGNLGPVLALIVSGGRASRVVVESLSFVRSKRGNERLLAIRTEIRIYFLDCYSNCTVNDTWTQYMVVNFFMLSPS